MNFFFLKIEFRLGNDGNKWHVETRYTIKTKDRKHFGKLDELIIMRGYKFDLRSNIPLCSTCDAASIFKE